MVELEALFTSTPAGRLAEEVLQGVPQMFSVVDTLGIYPFLSPLKILAFENLIKHHPLN